jgi:dienelactone hydrolase
MTINWKNPYPDMETITYDDGNVYEFKNNKSDVLIIFIEGQSWLSVLGYKYKDTWHTLGFGYYIIQFLHEEYNIMIPEKFNRQIGKDYGGDPQSRKIYDLNNLVENYSTKINDYLSNNYFSSIILVGHSEGAAVLPFVYETITDRERIKGLVAFSYGGLSRYEQIKILADSELKMPEFLRETWQNIDEYKQDINAHADSLAELDGISYRWYNSFLDYKPYDHYINITIPVLFIHGEKDINVPVESTRYVQENLPDKPFDYIYIDAAHVFPNRKTMIYIKEEGIKWLNKLL